MKLKNIQIPILLFTIIFLPFVRDGGSSQATMSAVELPQGVTITSAELSIYVQNTTTETVNLHRITADWGETTVTWNNFGGSYDPAVINSFGPSTGGWYDEIDVTSTVQGWINGEDNFGFLLEQGTTDDYATYRSSEYSDVAYRPKLDICYDGGSTCVTIQRQGADHIDVWDAYIWQLNPNYNGGNTTPLYTGNVSGYEKQSLIKFDFTLTPPSDDEGCTPGYWKQEQHFDSWTDPYAPGEPFYSPPGGFEDAFPGLTLLQVLNLGGGGLNALGRHTVAALLNAASPDVAYPKTVAEVIDGFNAVYPDGDYEGLKDDFEYYNEIFCPLD